MRRQMRHKMSMEIRTHRGKNFPIIMELRAIAYAFGMQAGR